MPRYKLTIEYDGTDYIGWQKQKDHSPSVQGCLIKAFRLFCHHDVNVYGSGRTDAGVHATGQIAHVDLEKEWPLHTIREAVNAYLRPHAIVLLSVEKVPDTFHARFSATQRHYIYRLIRRPAELTIDRTTAWHVRRPLNIEEMKKGAALLLGSHDFTSFRATECQSKSPFKTLDQFDLVQDGNEIKAFVSSRSFLHHQVRNMMGTLVWIGKGKMKPEDIPDILAAKKREAAGPTAPAHGLYLTRVEYPENF